MADLPKTAVLSDTQAPERNGREWLIDDSAREFYRSTLGPRQAPVATQSKPRGTKEAKASGTESHNKGPASGLAQVLGAKRRTRIGLWAVAALVCSSLAYGIWLVGIGSDASLKSKPSGSIATHIEKQVESPSPTATQPNQDGLSLSPSLAIIQCALGKSASQTLTLVNNTASELTFQVVAMDMVVQDGKAAFLRPGATPNSIAATAVLSQKYFNIKPRQTASLNATFTVHPQTTARGVLLLIQGTDKATFGGTTAVIPTLGTLISFVVPNGEATELSGVAPGPIMTPTSYTFSQWEMLASPSVLDADKNTSRPPDQFSPGIGSSPQPSQGNCQP